MTGARMVSDSTGSTEIERPQRNEHGGVFTLDPARCPATFDVPLILDDYDGPEPVTHQCVRQPHPRTEPHKAAVQWFSGEDDDL